jgi:hypothetical protein
MQPILFVDLDGVLVDLASGLSEILETDLKKVDSKEFTEKYYDFIATLSSDDLLKFWTNLPPMPEYLDLWNKVKHLQPVILTAVGGSTITCEGKKIWCKKHLGLEPDRVFCSVNSSDKQNYASSKSILIDDQSRNIEQFTKKGGYGIHHTRTKKTLKELGKLLQKWDLTI